MVKKIKLHPATYIFIWILIATALQFLKPIVMSLMTGGLLLIAFKLHTRQVFVLFRRTRWILFSLFVIYAFLTPGRAVWLLVYLPSPSYEGLHDGLMQIGRLMGVLAALAILLASLPKERFLMGIYALLYPISCFGFSRERVAVRLTLTLQYAEEAMDHAVSDWRLAMNRAFLLVPQETTYVEMHVQAYSKQDALLMLLGVLLFGTLL